MDNKFNLTQKQKKMKNLIIILVLFLTSGNFIKAQCLCGSTATESRWDSIGFRINDDPVKKYSCGYQLTVKTTAKITFVSGGYLCIDKKGCKAKISMKMFNGSVGVQSFDDFQFTETLTFPGPGNYRMVFSAKCGKNTCKTCTYYFKVL